MDWQFLIFIAGFYLLGVPIWLIVLTARVNHLRREAALREGVQRELPREEERGIVSKKRGEYERATPRASPEEAPRMTAAPLREKSISMKSFEEQVGLHWFQWLGIAALIVALVFFMKWAFDNGFIGPVGRTVIGYVLAGAAMIAGDRLRSRYGIWSLAFTGGGALASYIVTWVALHLYGLFPPLLALSVYTLTTLTVCLLAGYYKAIPLAAFGIVGGFLTPVLTGEGGSIMGLLSYILIIDLGVLALAHVRQWRALNALSFLGTVLWEFFAWMDGGMEASSALLFLAAFGAIYLLVPAVYNIAQQKKSESPDLLMLVGNGLTHFWLTLQWLDKTPGLRESIDAPVALGFAALFLAVSFGIYQKNKNDTPLVLGGLSLTVLFASIALPLQLSDVWVSLAWSIEASFLLWISLRLHDTRIQLFAWPVMAAAYVWYLFTPDTRTAVAFAGSGFWMFLLWAALFAGTASIALRRDDRMPYHLLPFALVGGIFLVVVLFSNIFLQHVSQLSFLARLFEAMALIGGSYLVLWQAQKQWSSLHPSERKGFANLGIGVQIATLLYLTSEYMLAIGDGKIFVNVQNKRQIMQVGISMLWAVYAALALVIGFLRGWRPLRLFAMVLLLVAIGKLTVFDLFSLGTGYRVIGFTVLGALLVGASFLYQRNKEQLKEFFVS